MPVRNLEGIAIFGGTFDPVHVGHLRSAVEIQEALGVSRIKLIPSYAPPHRDNPGSKPEDRLAMLRLAIKGVPFLEVDDREILREGKSYTIDTLRSIRNELGENLSISLVVGFDAFVLLDEWKEWKRLLDYAHLVILERPGSEGVLLKPELIGLLKDRLVDGALCLRSKPNGTVCRLKLTQLDVSASRVRQIFREGQSADFIVPGEVVRYIHEHGLYGTARK